MAATSKRTRAFALLLTILFFGTTFGFSFWVIYETHQSDKNAASTTTPQTTTPIATKGVTVGKDTYDDISTSTSGTPTHLAGTKLSNYQPVAIGSLSTQDIVTGTGAAATPTDTVSVNYTGAVAATGLIFQSSLDTGKDVSFALNQVIPGWTEGIPGMKVGGTRRLLIPASLAYGATPPSGSGIPANADLVFDVTLLGISGK